MGHVLASGAVRYLQPPPTRHVARPLPLPRDGSLPRVDIAYMHTDARADAIDHPVAAGAKAVVIAGVGNGNMSASLLAAAQRAIRGGTLVVRCSRSGAGFVGRNIEVPDDRIGTLAGGSLAPAKVRILLQLWLAEGRRGLQELQRVMLSY